MGRFLAFRVLLCSLLVGAGIGSAVHVTAQPVRFRFSLENCLASPGTPMPCYFEIYSLDCQRLEGGFGLPAYGEENLYVSSVTPGTYHFRLKLANGLTVWVRNVQMGWGGVRITFPTAVNGDANGNDIVDLGDMNAVFANFGNTGSPGIPGDLNWNGTVTLDDLTIVLLNFGKSGASC